MEEQFEVNTGILPDWAISSYIGINPTPKYEEKQPNKLSYGLSSYGYDIRLGNKFKIPKKSNKTNSIIIDPKNKESYAFCFEDVVVTPEKNDILIPPNWFVLAESLERFKIPDDVIGICLGKSSYARCGIIINITPLEPGWEGILTIEISNTAPFPCKIYAYEGIAQLLFFRATAPCIKTYSDRSSKYQNQVGIEFSKVT